MNDLALSAIRYAARPLAAEALETVGSRKHPRVSVWPMREKWRKYGAWWTYSAPDEPVQFANHAGPVLPLMMQLFYVRLSDNIVLQLIWERPDKQWMPLMEPVIGESFSVARTDSLIPALLLPDEVTA